MAHIADTVCGWEIWEHGRGWALRIWVLNRRTKRERHGFACKADAVEWCRKNAD